MPLPNPHRFNKQKTILMKKMKQISEQKTAYKQINSSFIK